MKKIILLLLITLLSNISIIAQKSSNIELQKMKKNELFNYSIGIFPTQFLDSMRVDLLFKINIDLFPFVNKYQDIKNTENFNSNLEIELMDSTGIIRNRIKIDVNGNHHTTNGLQHSILLNKSLSIKLIKYDVKIKLYIENKLIRVIKTEIPTDFIKEVFPGEILFAELSNVNTYTPFIFNDALKLTSTNPYIIFPLPINISKMNYTIRNVIEESSVNLWEKDLKFKGGVIVKVKNGLLLNKSSDYILIENSEYNTGLISIPNKLMKEGKYEISMFIDNDSIIYNYQIKWENKPKSLRKNLDYVLKLMHYVLPETMYDSVLSLNRNERARFINEYWLSYEVDGACFSSHQATFFQRADEASPLFATPKYSDGALTKRGEIYILFGKPDEIGTQIIKKVFTEIWIYDKLKEKYIFEMASPGEYKLKRIEKI